MGQPHSDLSAPGEKEVSATAASPWRTRPVQSLPVSEMATIWEEHHHSHQECEVLMRPLVLKEIKMKKLNEAEHKS